jgi:hypothetical protein
LPVPAWLENNQGWLMWVGGASLVLFVATLGAGPWFIRWVPPDYFTHEHRPPSRFAQLHPALRLTIRAARTLLALVCLGAGLAMLVLPGQGLLTILVGFLLLEFPGKYRLEKRLMARPRVLRATNAFRRRLGRPPLEQPRV